MWSSMNRMPSFGSSPCKTETRARLRRAGRMTRFVPSALNSVPSCGRETRVRGYERVELNANPSVAQTPTHHRSQPACRVWTTPRSVSVSRLSIEGSSSSGRPLKSRERTSSCSRYNTAGTWVSCKGAGNGTSKVCTYFPGARKTQYLVLGNIAHQKVIEEEPRVLEMQLVFRFGYFNDIRSGKGEIINVTRPSRSRPSAGVLIVS